MSRVETCRVAVLIVLLVLAAPDPARAESAAIPPVPSGEMRLGGQLPAVAAHDEGVLAFGDSSGKVCIVARENLRAYSLYSSDGGASFGPEETIADEQGSGGVMRIVGHQSSGLRVYLALETLDSDHGRGLFFVRSDDLCQSWSSPLELVSASGGGQSVSETAIGANETGRVAIAFLGDQSSNAAMVSSDHGETWTVPDTISENGDYRTPLYSRRSVVVDDGGWVYVAYTDGSSDCAYVARSMNGGLSFGTPLEVGAGDLNQSFRGRLVLTRHGTLLLALRGTTPEGDAEAVNVYRSDDRGASFAAVSTMAVEGYDEPIRLGYSRSDDTVLLAIVEEDSNVSVARSGTDGNSWGNLVLVGTGATGPLSLMRAQAGTWVLAWTHEPVAPPDSLPSALVSASTDDGAAWGAPVRAESSAEGEASTTVGELVEVDGDDVLLAFTEWRNDQSGDLFVSRSSASPLSFGPDQRIDVEGASVAPSTQRHVSVATDGVSSVYAVYSSQVQRPRTDVYVSRSLDEGYTFESPARLNTGMPGQRINTSPMVAATSDGYVYVVYRSRAPGSSSQELRFTRSSDYGASWLSSDTLLDTLPIAEEWSLSETYPAQQISALPGGTVLIAWSEGDNIKLARSTNGGDSFDIDEDADQDGGSSATGTLPRLCAKDGWAFLAYRKDQKPWVRASDDAGATWSSPEEPLEWGELLANPPWDLSLACGGAGRAFLLAGGQFDGAKGARFDSSGWDPPWELSSAYSIYFVSAAYADSSNLVALWNRRHEIIEVNHSTDGGRTFDFGSTPLTSLVPVPAQTSAVARVVGDGIGNVWVVWLEWSAGEPTVVVVHSDDGGDTWGSARALGADQQGGRVSFRTPDAQMDALPGALAAGYVGQRDSALESAVQAFYDVEDFDRDGYEFSSDCGDEDASVYPGAPELCDGTANDCNAPGYPAVPSDETDDDGDGYVECSPWVGEEGLPPGGVFAGNDCNDSNANTYPGASEVNDGADNQCPGEPGHGMRDETSTESGFFEQDDKDLYSWPAQPGATRYEAIRSDDPAFTWSCEFESTTGTSWRDTGRPSPGGVFFYLNRASSPNPGEWGATSEGSARDVPCTA